MTSLTYAIIGTIAAVLIIITLRWIMNDPSYKQEPIPKEGKERLVWQAKHGSNWAKMVLILMDEREMLTDISLAHMALEATMDIDKSSPEHDALYKAQLKYHNHIAHIYHEEESQ